MPFPHAITYVPGPTVAVVADGVALLVETDPTGPLVAACHDALTAGRGVGDLLDLLAGEPSPSFGLAGLEEGGLRLVIGGRVLAEFAGGALATISAAGTAPWIDQRLDGSPDLRLSLDDPAVPIDPSWPALPIDAGVVLAAALFVPAVPAPAPAPNPDAGQVRGVAVGAAPGGLPWRDLDDVVDPGSTPTDAPTVQTVRCANNHLNPPLVDPVCRVCGAPIPAQAPFLAPRPTLGVLVLESGQTVPVDRDVLLGRAPSGVDGPGGGEHPAGPRIVALPSPHQNLSRTHARVDIDGWLVQITDLGSTNGTVATVPGRHGVRLRAHEPFVLAPGTDVTLADEAHVRFEVPS